MRIKFFIFSLILSLPMWWGVNVLAVKTESLFFNYISQNQQVFKATVSSGLEDIARKQSWVDLEIGAKAAGSVLILPSGQEVFLFRKNIDEALPIASLTKLMSADIAWENFDLSQKVEIKQSTSQESANSNFRANEVFFLKDLLSVALVESNNSAVDAISEIIGKSAFVDLMNFEAKYLGMDKTFFANPTGLDPDSDNKPINQSTVSDLIKLAKHIALKPLILEMLSAREYDLYTVEGNFHHKAITTNNFLKSGALFQDKEIIGGKTGQTSKAKGSLLLIFTEPRKSGFLINIVLGSDDRFGDMEKMIGWVNSAFDL